MAAAGAQFATFVGNAVQRPAAHMIKVFTLKPRYPPSHSLPLIPMFAFDPMGSGHSLPHERSTGSRSQMMAISDSQYYSSKK